LGVRKEIWPVKTSAQSMLCATLSASFKKKGYEEFSACPVRTCRIRKPEE